MNLPNILYFGKISVKTFAYLRKIKYICTKNIKYGIYRIA